MVNRLKGATRSVTAYGISSHPWMAEWILIKLSAVANTICIIRQAATKGQQKGGVQGWRYRRSSLARLGLKTCHTVLQVLPAAPNPFHDERGYPPSMSRITSAIADCSCQPLSINACTRLLPSSADM